MTEITAAATAGHSSGGEGSKKIMARLGKLRERYRDRNAPAAGSVSVQRNELMAEPASTHHELSRKRLKRREGTESEKVTMNPEMIKQYSNFMESYVSRLQELQKTHELVLQDPHFRHERELMQMLSKDGRPDKAAIDRFVKTHQGMAIATQVLEDQTALMMFGLGLDMHARYGGHGPSHTDFEQRMPGSTLVNLGRSGIMRDRAGRLAHMFGTDVMGRLGGAASIATGAATGAYLANVDIAGFISAVGGAMTPTMIGSILGGGAGAAIARRFFQPNGDVDLRACPDGLNAIKGNPELLDYVRVMTGVNANDFDIDPTGTRVISTGGVTTTQNIDHVRRTIIQNLHTRSAFYEALGYPGTRRGESFEQLMTRPNLEGQRQWMTKWNQRMTELNPVTPDDFLEARRTILSEYIQDYRDQILGGKNREGVVTNIEKQTAEAQKRRTQEVERHETRRRRAQEDEAYVKGVKEEIYGKKPTAEGRISIEDAQQALDDARNAVGRIQSGKTEADIPTMISETVALINAQKTALNALPAALESLLNGIDSDATVRAGFTENKPIQDADGHTIGYEDVLPSRSVMIAAAKDRIAARKESSKEELARLQQELAAIEDAAVNIRNANKTLNDLGGREFSPFIQRSREMLHAITGFGTPPIITIAELANSTISIDTLLHRINGAHRVAHTGLPNQPWPESDNDRSEIRQRLIMARLEARVQIAAEHYMPIQETSLQMVIGVGRAGESHIQEGELTTMSVGVLRQRLTDLITNNPSVFTLDISTWSDSDFQQAIDAAKLRAEFRKAELDSMEVGLQGIQKDAEARKERAQDHEDVGRLRVIGDLVKRQGEVFSHLTGGEAALRNLLESQDAVRATDPDLNDAERQLIRAGAHIPRGYFRTIDMLFDHKSKEDNSEYFRSIQRVLSPAQLAQIIQRGVAEQELILPGVAWHPPMAPLTVNDIFQGLEVQFQNHALTERHLRALSSYIIDSLAEQARNTI